MSQYKAIVIGGSAGSFQFVVKLLGGLKPDFNIPILMCLHRLKHVRNGFEEVLNIKSTNKISEPEDKEKIRPGSLFLAPSNYHMRVEFDHTVSLSTEAMIMYSRPSIDILFDSAALVYREKAIGIIFSGANKDGVEGMARIKANGGKTIIQSLDEAPIKTMPEGTKLAVKVDHEYTTDQIIKYLNSL